MTTIVALDRIHPNPWQTRQATDEEHIRALAADIAARGLLQAPVGRLVDGDGRPVSLDLPADGDVTPALEAAGAYVQLAFGHNRLAAFGLLAQQDSTFAVMPVEIRELSDQEMALVAWSENAARKDLNPLEEAEAIQRMMESFGWTQAKVAERLGLTRSTVANKLRLLRLPDQAREQVCRGNLTERQALALLPALELPEPARERLAGTWYGQQVHEILEAPQGYSSDRIRGAVDNALHYATVTLDDAIFPLDEPVGEPGEVHFPRCTDCDLRVRRGTEWRCGDVDCHRAKTFSWTDHYLARVSGVLGVPVLGQEEKERIGYAAFDPLPPTEEGRAALARALEERCPNLHIAYYPNGYVLRPEDYHDIGYVCVHPGRRGCNCQKQARQQLCQAELAAEKERKRRLREVKDRAVEQVVAALAEGQPGAMRAVLVALSPWSDREKAMTITDLGTILSKIGRILVSNVTFTKDPDQFEVRFQEWVQAMGIAPAADGSPDPLAEVHRRWARINAWLGRLAHERPTPEAVRGNLANLDRLAEKLEEAVDGRGRTEEIEALAQEIAQAQETLEALLPVVEGWDGDGFEDVPWLVTIPAGGANFRSALKRATSPAIYYALALTRGREGNKTRVQALERELRRKGDV